MSDARRSWRYIASSWLLELEVLSGWYLAARRLTRDLISLSEVWYGSIERSV